VRTLPPAAGLLPVRFFFGATFLYAGLDKLVDARFLDPASPASIQAQMTGFARGSPIGELVRVAQPAAIEVGLLIAVAEIAIGLGALSGLALRVAAVGGAALSLLFFLTVSWTTHPYYLGSDLPYAVGWLALAIAGDGGCLVPRWVRGHSPPAPDRADRTTPAPSPGRRALLQTGVLAVAAVAVSALALPVRILGLEGPVASVSPVPWPSPASPAPGQTVTATAPSRTGIPVAMLADVDRRGSALFTIPFSAPAPLPAGDPGVVVRRSDGSYAAFDAVCTHAGCTVEWVATEAALVCPCHGATFDPEHGGAVLSGPAELPLSPLPIVVDRATGRILLRSDL
jgi:thiosulfate dehydrogenase [quinone] large subunit